MPYDRDQAQAIFLAIKRRKGLAAAKAFARKHAADFKRPAQPEPKSNPKYKPRAR